MEASAPQAPAAVPTRTLSGADARRTWQETERRIHGLVEPRSRPSYAQTFLTGFLRGSMLQMAVCAPPRQAATRPAANLLVTRAREAAAAISKA